jgi:hypothetical protein
MRRAHAHTPTTRATAAQGFLAEAAANAAQQRTSLQSLPVRSYLDSTVVPVLSQALIAVAQQRCACRLPAECTILGIEPLCRSRAHAWHASNAPARLRTRRPENPVEWLAAFLLQNDPARANPSRGEVLSPL